MAKEIGRYDRDLQMFVEKPQPINKSRLLFERWLCETGRGEHYVEGVPTGEIALAMVISGDIPIHAPIKSVEQIKPEVKRRIIVQGD